MPILILILIHNWLHFGYFSAGAYTPMYFTFDMIILSLRIFALVLFGADWIFLFVIKVCKKIIIIMDYIKNLKIKKEEKDAPK
jgi:hypothetical protein